MIDETCEWQQGGTCSSSARYMVRLKGDGSLRVCSDHAEDAFPIAAEIVPLDPPPCCSFALRGVDVILCESCGRALCAWHTRRDGRSFACDRCVRGATSDVVPAIGWRTPRSAAWIPCVHRELGIVVRHRAVDPCPLCLLERDAIGERLLKRRPPGPKVRLLTDREEAWIRALDGPNPIEEYRRHVGALTNDRPIEGSGVCVRPASHSAPSSDLDRATGEGGSITTGAPGDPRLSLARILAKIGGNICAPAKSAIRGGMRARRFGPAGHEDRDEGARDG